ncbi:MAG: hypothetical protein RMJ67_01355 [Elusimicrobiota bacterium]|nr:hypothetical protein [Endomicrobiia bacterium]MDW8165151.1 hypothetical protein [Elusimicrobiota bacterium]
MFQIKEVFQVQLDFFAEKSHKVEYIYPYYFRVECSEVDEKIKILSKRHIEFIISLFQNQKKIHRQIQIKINNIKQNFLLINTFLQITNNGVRFPQYLTQSHKNKYKQMIYF